MAVLDARVSAPPVLSDSTMFGTSRLALGHCDALGAFPPLKREMSAGGCQNRTAEYGYSLYAHPPGKL